jgi:hypothetical protein
MVVPARLGLLNADGDAHERQGRNALENCAQHVN